MATEEDDIHVARFGERWYFDGTGPIEREPTRDQLVRSNIHGPYHSVAELNRALAEYANAVEEADAKGGGR